MGERQRRMLSAAERGRRRDPRTDSLPPVRGCQVTADQHPPPEQFGLPDRPAHGRSDPAALRRSEEHTSELQSQFHLVCRLLLEKKKKIHKTTSQVKKHYLNKLASTQTHCTT